MIDFILDGRLKNDKEKFEELIKDLSRIASLENISVKTINGNSIIPPELFSSIRKDLRPSLNDVYGTVTSSQKLKDCVVTSKYWLKKKQNKIQDGNLPKFADFFSGAGGLSLGLEQSGFQPEFVSDHNFSALQTYYLNHDLSLDKYHFGDMRQFMEGSGDHLTTLKNTFLIAGGPPCQGFSTANRQPLLNDSRNELYKDFLLILQEIKPPFFLLENVRGMSRKIAEIKKDMEYLLGEEYEYSFLILNAKDYNIPQNRERFFIVGNRIGVNPSNIELNIKSQARGSEFKLRHALEGLPEIQAGTDFNQPFIENDRIGYKIRKYNIPETVYSQYINSGRKQGYLFNHKSRFNNENDREIFKRLPQGGNSHHYSIQDILKYKNRKDIFKDKYYKLLPDKECKAITSHMRFDCHMYIHPWQARGLSPREAARVQTFPDDYIFMGRPNEWYQQVGNAVPVKLAEVLGKEIIKYWQ